MPIYTRKGDKGETGTFDGKRISKDSLQTEILGTIDEANSFLGLSASLLEEKDLINKIVSVQKNLFKLGSIIAGAKGYISKSVVIGYEKEMDKWTRVLPNVQNFIFPGGVPAASALFTARAIIRRAERLIVKYNTEKGISSGLLMYINRLSDYVFMLARYINFRKGGIETIWKGR